ncbi:phosphatidylinositol 4,5-bisphosphate 5-phosphatase A-like [Oscarella lobularis]|uniref:phosphatidylinositol 4,5-bisphosphate 5-phosphatase A-like n=1 Tax=Oscarella lobularis TaxID=121494 RepID=UPI003313FE21
MRVYCCSWNVARLLPSDDLALEDWLNVDADERADIYSVCLQEVSLFPPTVVSDDPWTKSVTETFARHSVIRLSRGRQLGLILMIFVRPYLLPFITNIEEEYVATGIGGVVGNKGAAMIRFRLHGVPLCFTGVHMAAHTKNLERRNEEYHQILKTKFSDPRCETLLDHEFVFWSGDLNYRLDESVSQERAVAAVHSNETDSLKPFDQLRQEQSKGAAFSEFLEGPITFPPTYRYDVGTQDFDSSPKARVPSWCDRILWRSRHKLEIGLQQDTYTSYQQYCNSDHKPIAARFTIEFQPENAKQNVEFAFPKTTWACNQNASILYSLEPGTNVSSWDWIGLYKIGWCNLKDYVTYCWACSDDKLLQRRRCQVILDAAAVPSEPGLFQLIYHSRKYDRVLGISPIFEISKECYV